MSDVIVAKDEDSVVAEKLGDLVVSAGDVLAVPVAQEHPAPDLFVLKTKEN